MQPATLTPATSAPIEIGTHGYVLGAQFYRGLVWKRVKGKLKVRGPRKIKFSDLNPDRVFSPWGWQQEKKRIAEEKAKLAAKAA